MIVTNQLEPVHWIAGVDVGFEENYTVTRAAVAVFKFPELELTETAIATLPTCFPYIPGLLSFREIPAILEVLKKLRIIPNLILCDGQGIAHPRRLGIASHLGVLIDCPTIGVAKSRLVGFHEEVPLEKGNWTPLSDQGETVGVVLRTKTKVKPFIFRVDIGSTYLQPCSMYWKVPPSTVYPKQRALPIDSLLVNLKKILKKLAKLLVGFRKCNEMQSIISEKLDVNIIEQSIDASCDRWSRACGPILCKIPG